MTAPKGKGEKMAKQILRINMSKLDSSIRTSTRKVGTLGWPWTHFSNRL